MPKKKKSKKEEREELKKQRLAAIAQKREEPIIQIDSLSESLREEDQRNIEYMASEESTTSAELDADEKIIQKEKNAYQKEMDSFREPVIYDVPDFLLDSEREDERREVMEKLKFLLKRRFSLITIADILETNDYSKLDEIVERKESTYAAIEKYSEEDEKSKIKLFSGFKRIVGDDYSRIYAEQEERMKAAITILTEGKYFKNGLNAEELSKAIEDIIASIIDHPEFSLACQIEAEFMMFEAERAEKALGDLRSRAELKEVLEELRTISRTASERAHAYSVMEKLITGRDRKIIPPEEGEER